MKLLLLVLTTLTIAACAAGDGTASGYYRANGIESALNFARAGNGQPMTSGDPTIDIAFTEKDASGASTLDSNIVFLGKYGSAILVNLYKSRDGSWSVLSSSFHHSKVQRAGGSGGDLQIKNLSVANGQIAGEVYSKPGAEMFDAKIDVDVKFKALLPKH